MKFETINPYSYDMPERETFMASVLQHYLNSLTRDQAREEIQKIVYQDETGKIVIEVKILASMFDMALEKAYGYLMHADDGDPLEKAIAYRLQEYLRVQGCKGAGVADFTTQILHPCAFLLQSWMLQAGHKAGLFLLKNSHRTPSKSFLSLDPIQSTILHK